MKKAHRRQRQARVEWLRQRPALYENLPSLSDDVTPDGRAGLEELVNVMTDAGCFSQNTPRDQRLWGLRDVIGELRGQGTKSFHR